MKLPKFRAAIERHQQQTKICGNHDFVYGNHVRIYDDFEEQLARIADEQPELFAEISAPILSISDIGKMTAEQKEKHLKDITTVLKMLPFLAFLDPANQPCIGVLGLALIFLCEQLKEPS